MSTVTRIDTFKKRPSSPRATMRKKMRSSSPPPSSKSPFFTGPFFIGPSPVHGTGCFANRDFTKGERIGEYTGRRISEAEADSQYAHAAKTYLFLLEDGTVIDATNDKNPLKYINHSCAPNCEAIEEEGRIYIYTLRDIKKGEELFYDYNLVSDEELPCHCGAPTCRGTMRGV